MVRTHLTNTFAPRCPGFFDLVGHRRRRHTGGTSRSRWAIQAENPGQPAGLWLFGPIAVLALGACSCGYYSPRAAKVFFQGDIVVFSVKTFASGTAPFAGNVENLSKDGNTAWGKGLSALWVSPKPPIAVLLALTIGTTMLSSKRLALDGWGLTEQDNIALKEHPNQIIHNATQRYW